MTKTASNARISPTAHYTGYTWYHHGLGCEALITREGQLLFKAAQPVMALASRLGAPTLDGMLLARHHGIDAQLHEAIGSGRVGQVIEIASGLSPRGQRFMQQYAGRLTYIETDLPEMACRKRELLGATLSGGQRHRIEPLDALATSGPLSLSSLAATLDRSVGTAIVSEGLVNYFPKDALIPMWTGFAKVLHGFPAGLYLSDLHLGSASISLPAELFKRGMRRLGKIQPHFDFRDELQAEEALNAAGFSEASVDPVKAVAGVDGRIDRVGARLVRIIVATTD